MGGGGALFCGVFLFHFAASERVLKVVSVCIIAKLCDVSDVWFSLLFFPFFFFFSSFFLGGGGHEICVCPTGICGGEVSSFLSLVDNPYH